MQPPHPSDPPVLHAALDQREVRWVDAGPRGGPCVVMVHGLPGSHRDFRWLAAPLEAAGLRVIRIDMPGFGRSSGARSGASSKADHPGSARLSRLAEHVLGRLDQLELSRLVLLGHSFGGAQAVIAASRDPERIRGLVLLASVGLRPHRALRATKALRMVDRGLSTPLVSTPLMNRVRAVFRRSGFPKSTPDREIRRSVRVAARVDFRMLGNAAAAIRVPTCVAACDDDRLIEPSITDELAAALPPGPRLRFPDGGHNLQKTRACELAEVLAPWIVECLAP